MENPTVKNSRKKITRAPRFKAAFPVHLGEEAGVVKDISATGLFLELPKAQDLGAEVHLEIDLETPSGQRRLKLAGVVVRLEQSNGRMGMGIKISNQELS